MGAEYTRQSTFTDGDIITAAHSNDEFNQLLAAFAAITGHTHDGTTAEGGPITKLIGSDLTFGDSSSSSDTTITFTSSSNTGILKWDVSEEYFEFSDDILIASTEKLQFRDTAIYINSSTDGQLDLVADTEIQIAATTIDIDGNADISGNLTVGGNFDVTGTIDFSDSAITNVGSIQLDSISGDADTDTSIAFSGSDVITFANAGTNQVTFNDGSILPVTTNDIDLGSSSLEFKDAFFDGTITTDALVADTADINGGSIDGITLGTNSAVTNATITTATISNATIDTGLNVTTTTGGVLKLQNSDTSVSTNDSIGSLEFNTTADSNAGTMASITANAKDNHDSGSGTIDNELVFKLKNANFLDTVLTFTNSTAGRNPYANFGVEVDVENQLSIVTSGTSDPPEILFDNNDTTIADAQVVSRLLFQSADGNSEFSRIDYVADGAFSSSNNKADLIFYMGTGSSITERMKLEHEGNLILQGDLTVTGDDIKMNTNTSGHIMVADGTSYNPVAVSGDVTISSAGVVTIANNAVETAMVNANIISGQTAETTIDTSNDVLLMFDNSASALRKITISSLSTAIGAGDITAVTAGVGLSGGGTSGDVTLTLDLSELSDVTPVNGDKLATLDSDGSTEQLTTIASLATLFAGTGLSATNSVMSIEAAQTGITSLLATDIKIGEDNETKIDFETPNEIHFYANNAEQVYVSDGVFGPQTDSDVDLGTTSVRWKDAYIDTITTTGNVTIGGDLTVTGDDITMGTNTSGHIMVADGTNFNPVAVSGDVTIDSAGAVTIAATSVENSMLAGSIADTKLNTISTADKVSLSALDIDGGSDIGADLTTSDLIVVDDGAGGTNRKAALSRLTTFMQGQGFSSEDPTALAIALG